MRSNKPLFIIVLLTGILNPFITLIGQEPAFKQFDTESGLPSNEVYNLTLDKDKVLWAVTNRGVARYDGNTWKIYTTSDGLLENVHLRSFYLANKEEVWVTSFNNHLSMQKGGQLVLSPFDKVLSKTEHNSKFLQQIALVNDTLYAAYNYPGLISISPDGTEQKIENLFENHPESDVCLFVTDQGYYWNAQERKQHEKRQKTKLESDKNRIYISLTYQDPSNLYRKYICSINNDPNEFLLSISNHLLHIKNGRLIQETEFNNEIMTVFVDREGGFWVGVDYEGLYHYPFGHFNQLHDLFLRDEFITGCIQDHEGNFWISTRGNGIFTMNTHRMIVYTPKTSDSKDRIVRGFEILNDELYYSTEGGHLFKITKNNPAHSELIFSTKGPIRRMLKTPQNTLMLMANVLIEINARGDSAGYRSFPSYPYSFLNLPNQDVVVTYPSGFHIMHPDGSRLAMSLDDLKKIYPDSVTYHQAMIGVRTLFIDKDSIIWIGTQHAGIFKKIEDRLISLVPYDSLFYLRATSITQMGDQMIFSFSDFGINILHPDLTTTHVGKNQDGLSSDIVDALYAENDTTLWAGTGEGLNRIIFETGLRKIRDISYFTMREGIPSNRIMQIGKFHDTIWVASSRGLLAINPQVMIPSYTQPSVIINNFVVANETLPIQDEYFLRSDQNSLTIRFNAISYREHKGIKHRYRLIGYDTDWVESDNLEAVYNKLRGGKYTFVIEAWYPEKPNDLGEEKIQIEIDKKFSQTTIFIFLILLAGVGCLFLFIKQLIEFIKRRETRKQQLLMAEKKALLSQMNPHFIFNSLNSIQFFILQNDEFQANNYLANFSSLIRRILENSKKNLISLAEEIETLNLYLNMEKLRFEEEFDFELIRDTSIEYNETMIPPMLVQPFVENAIWHGLTPLGKKGLLRIIFTASDSYYFCTIEDNGIGRERSATMKENRTSHQSTGLKNVEERIRLMNLMSDQPIDLTIEDLYDTEGKPSGTRVNLKIPIRWT